MFQDRIAGMHRKTLFTADFPWEFINVQNVYKPPPPQLTSFKKWTPKTVSFKQGTIQFCTHSQTFQQTTRPSNSLPPNGDSIANVTCKQPFQLLYSLKSE